MSDTTEIRLDRGGKHMYERFLRWVIRLLAGQRSVLYNCRLDGDQQTLYVNPGSVVSDNVVERFAIRIRRDGTQ